VQHGVGLGEPGLELRPFGAPLGAGAIGIAAPAEINFGQIGLVVPDPLVDQGLEPGSVGAGLRPEDTVAGPPSGLFRTDAAVFERLPVSGDTDGQRVYGSRLVERRDCAGGGIHKVDQPRKGIAEKPRHAM
jgi:hypothetical protein